MADALVATGWQSISMPWHAKANGLRLRIEKIAGRQRYFGERRKITVRKVVKPWQPPTAAPQQKMEFARELEPALKPAVPTPLAAFCAANNFSVTIEGKRRFLRCQGCYLGFRIFQRDDSVSLYISVRLKQHAEIHRHQSARKEERHDEQCGQLAQQA